MNTVPLPEVSIWLDEQRVECETLMSVAERSMMLNSFVPAGDHELHSSYVDAGGETVVASHLLVAAELGPEPSSATLRERELTRAGDRRRCLLEHLALLRDALAERDLGSVRLEVGDAALRVADATAPTWPSA